MCAVAGSIGMGRIRAASRIASNCPTLAEAKAAVPIIASGPDANGVPFKTMVLQCGYAIDERDIEGRPAGIGSHTRQGGIPADQLVALARAMLTGLARPPR